MMGPLIKIILCAIVIVVIYYKVPEDASLDFKLGMLTGFGLTACCWIMMGNFLYLLVKFGG